MHKYHTLSIKDLLEARDQYHIHLMNKKNVIATAIGRYLIRKDDPMPRKQDGDIVWPKAKKKGVKDLENTEIRPYSWPCILVFVSNWIKEDQFGNKFSATDMVPDVLYLPDGREVPVCVIEAHQKDIRASGIDAGNLLFPDTKIGGGYPIIADVQGKEHVASIGCLVTDGHFTYALTNRHVSGEPGERLYTIVDGEKTPVGKSSRKQLSRKKFSEVYEGWPGKDIYVNMDVGLIEIDNLKDWTAEVLNMGQLGEIVDLSVDNITLDLIGCKVKAFGCASHQMQGEIRALFYRYKALGGYEYVADFLIGRQSGKKSPEFATGHGDSATLWVVEKTNRPIAIQWGGHVYFNGDTKKRTEYALATCLSTVCNHLEVDVVRDFNIGLDSYWAAVGHYTIGLKACELIKNERLKELMWANHLNISFEESFINDKNLTGLSDDDYIPLADVPDYVWNSKSSLKRKNEAPNHFTDMDKRNEDGKNLFDLCADDPSNISVAGWRAYYDSVDIKQADDRGLLPFRIWQIYNSMVEFVRNGEVDKFVCAAGAIAHYVGDCTNPLHLSYLHHGDPEDMVNDKPRAQAIHDCYEKSVLKYHIKDIMIGLNEHINNGHEPLGYVNGGKEAFLLTYELINKTYTKIKPRDLIDTYNSPGPESKPKQKMEALWTNYQKETVDILFNACRYLALLWDSAWEEGGGDDTIGELGEIDRDRLKELYLDKDFLPSMSLDEIEPLLY